MINVTVKGDAQCIAKLEKLSKGLADLQPAFTNMQDLIVQEFKANFGAKGAVLNQPWAARKGSYPWPILNKTGKLKNSWETKAESKKLTINNVTDYAGYHHFGTKYLPVRTLVAHSANIIKIAQTRIIAYLKGLIS